MSTAGAGTLVPPGAGAVIELGLGRPTIKVGPPLSTQIGLVESELPPGGGFAIPHWHEDLYEVFYVLEGEIEYLLGGDCGVPRPAPPCSSRPGPCTRSATPAGARPGIWSPGRPGPSRCSPSSAWAPPREVGGHP